MNDRLTSDYHSHVQVLLADIRPFLRLSLPTGVILSALGYCDLDHFRWSAVDGRLGNRIRLIWILAGHLRQCLRWPSLESHTSRNAGQIHGTR